MAKTKQPVKEPPKKKPAARDIKEAVQSATVKKKPLSQNPVIVPPKLKEVKVEKQDDNFNLSNQKRRLVAKNSPLPNPPSAQITKKNTQLMNIQSVN